MRTRILPLAALGFLAACAADAPARSAPVTPPPEPATLPLLFGERTPVEDGATLQAHEADSRLVLWLLGREGATGFVAAGGDPVTGFAAAPNRAVLFDELAARPGLTIAPIGAGTRVQTVSASEPGIPALALLEAIAKDAGAAKGVRVDGGVSLPEISVFAKEVRADALVAAIATATATKIELRGGQLVVTGTPGQTAAARTVRTLDASEAGGATLIATVVDARHRQALFRAADGGLRVALDASAVTVEDGRVTASGKTLTVLPEPPPPQSVPPDAPRRVAPESDAGGAGGKKKSVSTSAGSVMGDSPDRDEEVAKVTAASPERTNPALSLAAPKPAMQPAPGRSAWAVEPFREKQGWLGAHEAALAKRFRGASWGDAFALALERALRERGQNAKTVPQKLSHPQIKKLVEEQKLRWIVAGDLKALAVKADEKTASLSIGLNVRKQSGAKLIVVDARTIHAAVDIGGAAPTDEDLLALMRASAEKAADAVVLTIPHDLLTGRN